jgi:hypothetical protein
MKFNAIIISSLLTLSISQVAISADTETIKPDRWFEVEVILFKHLGDKALLKEQFPDGINASNLPHYSQSFDLLDAYLQPDLTSVKQFLPLCGESDTQRQFLASLKSVTLPLSHKMAQFEQDSVFTMPDFTKEALPENTQDLSNEDNIAEQGLNKEENVNASNIETIAPEVDQDLSEAVNETPEEIVSTQTILPFELDLQKTQLAKPLFSTNNLCIMSKVDMQNFFDEQQLNDYKLDGFRVEQLPTNLHAAGSHNTDSPYLIADESLVLKDINQRLRWSKEFKPLLHFGWRQIGITQKHAIPLKLFAGEHLQYKYQQTLNDYQTELAEANAIEENLLEQLAQAQTFLKNSDNTLTIAVDDKIQIQSQRKQQALKQLFSHIELLNEETESGINNDTINDVINRIDEQDIESIITNNSNDTSINEQARSITQPPTKPLQPWLLDGFIKIHLDHYLYINADFNVLNQDPSHSNVEVNKTDSAKLINFSQNRRVITGEIHYFDHPYIGMVVQIRRFDPTKPADEAVSQAIK